MGSLTVNHIYKSRRHYGFGSFLWDLFLTFITGGLWLVWLVFKFLRSH